MTRSKKFKQFTVDDIYFLTDGGRLIYESELGSLPTKKILSPLREDKANPAFSIFQHNSLYLWKDWASGDSGNAISFIQKRYNLDFKTALEHIKGSLGLSEGNIPERPKSVQKGLKTAKKSLFIEVQEMEHFNKLGIEYWKAYNFDEGFLRGKDVFQVEKLAYNKKIVKIGQNEAVFAYYAPDVDKYKLLKIGENVKKEDKWRNNLDGSYLWYYHLYKNRKVENMFVCKSVKDCLTFMKLGYDAIAVQSEDAKVFLSSNIDKVRNIANNVFINFGADTQGTTQSQIITQSTGFQWINTEKYLLKWGINDFAELSKEFGLKTVDNCIKKALKKKKLL